MVLGGNGGKGYWDLIKGGFWEGWKVTSGRMAAGSIRTLQLHCARVLYESLFVPFFIFDIKI